MSPESSFTPESEIDPELLRKMAESLDAVEEKQADQTVQADPNDLPPERFEEESVNMMINELEKAREDDQAFRNKN